MEEILAIVAPLNVEQQVQWMIQLGYEFTVSARDGYPFQEISGNLETLQGFNELQHAVYGRIRHLRRGQDWKVEDFLDRLVKTSHFYGINGQVGWAIRKSVERFS